MAKVRREIAGQQALIKQLEMKRGDVMQAAAMDQVRTTRACHVWCTGACPHVDVACVLSANTHILSLLHTTLQRNSSALAPPQVVSDLQIDLPRADGDGAAPMETDDTADGDRNAAAAAAAAELDFSRLKRQHLGTHTPAERDKVAAELESGIEETKAQLERVAPNLKVGLRAAKTRSCCTTGQCTAFGTSAYVRSH